MTSSEGEGQPPPRKRSRGSANSDDSGNKKARGRPRVDTQDATAADRRRTQIRLAQRAYRQRKETTIASLKQENTQLQSIIEQMNTSFLRFNDAALKSGLLQFDAALGRELKHVTETFVSLAKSAVDQSHDEEEETGEVTLDAAAELHDAARSTRVSNQQSQPLPPPEHTNVGWGYASTHAGTTREDPPVPKYTPQSLQHSDFFQPSYGSSNQSSLVRSMPRMFIGATTGQVMDQTRSISPLSDTAQHQTLPFGLVDRRSYSPPPDTNPRIFTVNIPSPLTPPQSNTLRSPPPFPILSSKTLKPSWTYSHDETTFARRLTRAALEAGFHLLSGANLRPAALQHVFRLSLPYLTLDDLRTKFKTILARSTEEELDVWDTPFIHLGGAGTHYPRKDAHGNIIPIPNSWTVRSIGPPCAKLVRAESLTNSLQDHDLKVDLTGFEGEWFDAHDVQGYLEDQKGCHIDPKDSFAEVIVDVEEEPNGSKHAYPSSLLFSKETNLDFSDFRKPSTFPSESPGLSSGSCSEPSSSNKSTPGNNASSMDSAFRQSDAPFGLDMGVGGFEFGKFPNIDSSTLYDQPLALDLAPGLDANLNTTMAGFSTHAFGDMHNLGMDLMGGDIEQLPVVKPKQKKAAWIDVTKFINEIIKHGVCLGRAPGFRRKDVDMAFSAALITSF